MGIKVNIKSGGWSIFFFFSMLTILFLLKPSFSGQIDNVKLISYSSFFFVAVFIHFLVQKGDNWFRLDVLFLLGFVIVHFQWSIMLAFSGIEPERFSEVFLNARYINYGTWISTVGGISWLSGYAFLSQRKKENMVSGYRFNYMKLFLFSVILFILFLLMAGSNFLSGGIYKGHGGSSTGEGVSVYFQVLFSVSILLLTVFVILSHKNLYRSSVIFWLIKFDKKYMVLAGAYILLFLSVGDRGGPMQLVFTFLVLFGAIVRPIKLRELVLIIIAGAFLMTLIAHGRSVEGDDNILVAGFEKTEFLSGYDFTVNLANSARTLYSALSHVPNYHDYFYGQLWVGNLLSTIPFAQSTVIELTDINSYELSSARYLTYLRYGLNPSSGEGTSLIADFYMNFGLVGVIIFMFLLGLLFKKMQNELDLQQNLYWIIAAAMFASFAFYMGRGNFAVVYKPILYGFALYFIMVKSNKKSE